MVAHVLSTDQSSLDEAGHLTSYCAQKAVQTPRNLYANIYIFYYKTPNHGLCLWYL